MEYIKEYQEEKSNLYVNKINIFSLTIRSFSNIFCEHLNFQQKMLICYTIEFSLKDQQDH
jgi:hypothetical protein